AGAQAGVGWASRHREYDRDDRCRPLCSDDWWCCIGENDIDLKPDELGRDLGEALLASLGPAIFDRDGAILDPSELAEPLHKGGDPLALDRMSGWTQVPDGRQLPLLLRARGERPRRRARPAIPAVRW